MIKGPARVREALGTVLHHEQSIADDFPARMRGDRECLRPGLQTVVEELAGIRDRRFRGELAARPPLAVRVDYVAWPECVQDASRWASAFLLWNGARSHRVYRSHGGSPDVNARKRATIAARAGSGRAPGENEDPAGDTGVRGGPEPEAVTLEAFHRDIPEV